MICTEGEAKGGWCPMVRVTEVNGSGFNSDGLQERNPVYARCIASSCLMWRWIRDGNGNIVDGREGYCGLGGKP